MVKRGSLLEPGLSAYALRLIIVLFACFTAKRLVGSLCAKCYASPRGTGQAQDRAAKETLFRVTIETLCHRRLGQGVWATAAGALFLLGFGLRPLNVVCSRCSNVSRSGLSIAQLPGGEKEETFWNQKLQRSSPHPHSSDSHRSCRSHRRLGRCSCSPDTGKTVQSKVTHSLRSCLDSRRCHNPRRVRHHRCQGNRNSHRPAGSAEVLSAVSPNAWICVKMAGHV